MLFKKSESDKSAGDGAKSAIPLPAAVGLLLVALVLLFFTVLRPRLFSEAPPPPAQQMEGMPAAPPLEGPEGPPPPAAPGGAGQPFGNGFASEAMYVIPLSTDGTREVRSE